MFVYWIRRSVHSDLFSEGYIGITKNYKDRLLQHYMAAINNRHCNRHLKFALLKYDDIEVHILFDGSTEECKRLEGFYRPKPNTGWNIAPGGIMPPISANRAGSIVSDETRMKLRLANLGQRRSPATEFKIGNHPPTEFKKGNIPHNKGVPVSEETRAKIKEKRALQVITEETKKKMSVIMSTKYWWNNGKINRRSETCPGLEWKRGRR